jgi:hypothetical protein
MFFVSCCTRLSIIIAICAGGSFGGLQVYGAAKAEAARGTVSKPDLIVAMVAKASDRVGTLSPIYPTIKYTVAQLAAPPAVVKKKVAVRRAIKMPMQIAYIPGGRIVR